MGFMKTLKRRLLKQLAQTNLHLESYAERQIILQAQSLIALRSGSDKLARLQDAEFCAFSQWGEDGIISWLVDHLPGIEQSFIEFGVGDYRESNTRFLLQLRNWRGLVIDGSPEHIADIRGQDIYWRHDLQAKQSFITAENINELIRDSGLIGDIGLLSVDIDGNDYWVWQAIECVRPAIVVCEYNAIFGDKYKLTVPYQDNFLRSNAHYSHLYFGASLPAMMSLAEKKGYQFIGTTSSGCNAFFVRNDLSHRITPFLGAIWAFPSKAREARAADGELLFLGGPHRLELIKHMEVVDLDEGCDKSVIVTKLMDKGDLYSDNWRLGKGGLI